MTNYIFYLSFVFLIFFGTFVLNKNFKSITNRLFFSFCIIFAFWMSANFFVDVFVSKELSYLFIRLDFALASIFSYFFLLFCLYFPEVETINKKQALILLIAPAMFALLSIFTDLIVSNLVPALNGYEVSYGILEIPYDLFLVGYILFGIVYSLLKLKRLSGKEKSQLVYVIIGLFFLTSFVLVSNLILPIIFANISTINRIGYLGAVIWAIFTTYAIVKKQLFDIKVILTETASGIVIVALVSQLIISQSLAEKFTSAVILVIISYGAYLLIKSVQEEIKKKEKLQELTMQLGQANAHLQELDMMKTEFVSLASHELLTPVSAIEGYLSMILDEKLVKVADPTLERYLDRVYRSAKRLARLIADMLNISRIEEGRLLVEKKDTEISALVRQVIDEIKFKAEERKQKIVFEDNQINRESDNQKLKETESQLSNQPVIQSSTYPTYADPDKIKEVIVNLVGNSIKYSKDPGTITITIEKVPTALIVDTWNRIENEIKARPLDDQEAIKSAADPHMRELVGDKQYLIHIKDQGIGIPHDELPRLFKKFHRVGDFTTAESQGTGLGLYISRALIELNHGRIWADSEGEGKGSIFSFSLPDIAVKDKIIELEKQAPQHKEQLKPLAKPMQNDDAL